MKVVILAGGFGTRLSEHTGVLPKPMLPIGNRPLIWHIMQWYAKFGHTDFVIALGYKEEMIREYFHNFFLNESDVEIQLSDGNVKVLRPAKYDWRVRLVSTGLETMTGGRLKRLQPHIGRETFLFTYGDGVSNVAIDQLIAHHHNSDSFATLTAVRPTARFGELKLRGDQVITFEEKPQVDSGWINGGFMVLEPEVFDYIDGDHVMFEREPLTRLAMEGKLSAYQHHDFWQCVDTKREYDRLQEMYNESPPWINGKA